VKIDEIDQKRLKTIRRDFINHSQLRFKRMEANLSPTQSDYLNLLPLLFHVNHPMLPGYVDKFTPCGLPNYMPTMVQKQIAKTVSQSFQFKPRAHLTYRIAGLYLMGSMGTLGQSVSSDIDLWICLAEPLENSLSKKLNEKASKIKNWLAGVGIELNYYLVNLDDFSHNKSKKIAVDNCGNTQNFLLLDEFYRTAVWIAGRWPLWWLIPTTENYDAYAKRLVEQKHIDPADWIDFGKVQQIPANEYFSAALWQLYKAIESPYKSSVKLLVLEVYAKLFPCAGVLSDKFKNKVHEGYSDSRDTDPYFLVLNFAEKALKDNPQRLEFLRRAFYLKVNVKIKGTKKVKPNWRYQMIMELTKEWGWNQERLDYLNSRHLWSIRQVINERKDLVRELTGSYHFLSNFARLQGVVSKIAKVELLSLGRRLYAAFERRNGKFDILNNGIAKDIVEATVTFNEDLEKGWQVYISHLDKVKLVINQSVFVGTSLFDCLCWGCANGIINNNTQCQVYAASDYLDQRFATEGIKDITKALNLFSRFTKKIDFDQAARIIVFGLFINSRTDPLKEDKKNNLYSVATQSDCLSWTENKLNLASHFDMLALNSWSELTIQYFSGETAWIDFFKQYQHSLPESSQSISMYCRGLVQNDDIIKRITNLLQEWKHLSLKSQKNKYCNQYLMTIGKKWFGISFIEGEIFYQVYSSLNSLFVGLSDINKTKTAKQKISYEIDPWLSLSPFMQKVFSRRLSNNLALFIYQKTNQSFEVAVKSVSGRIHYQTHRNTSSDQLIAHYQQFFNKVRNRADGELGIQENINYYLFIKNRSQFKRIEITEKILHQPFSLVQAIAVYRKSRLVGFDFFTSNESYLYIEYGEQVYVKLVKQLLNIRKEFENYPIFLTDLDLSQVNIQSSFIELLGHKRLIEEKLNRVMKKLFVG